MSGSARCDEQTTARQHECGWPARQPRLGRLLADGPAGDPSVIGDGDGREDGNAVFTEAEPEGEVRAALGDAHERDGAVDRVENVQVPR